MTPYHHAVSSAKKFGGTWKDYENIHAWFDETKGFFPDFRHRALRHHSQGVLECEKAFGNAITISTGAVISVRLIAEQHIKEDCGRIPSVADWLSNLKPEPWMLVVGRVDP